MSAHNAARKLHSTRLRQLDPGASGTILVKSDLSYFPLSSATTETRTLARPTKDGQDVTIMMEVDTGDITMTVTGGYNEDGDTTFTFSDPGQFIRLVSISIAGTYSWRKIADHGTGNLTATEANLLSGLTASAADINTLDVQTLAVTPGVGVTGGSGTVAKISVNTSGSLVTTRYLVDLTGLNGGGTADDIIGTNGAGVAHWGQLATAVCGTILGGRVTCLETPAGGNIDIDLWTADEATGVEDTGISALTNEVQLINHGNWAAGETAGMIAPPAANQYLYFTNGTSTSATYTAGQFLVEFFGYI